MSAPTTSAQPKITYSAIGGDLDAIHAGFESALATERTRFGGHHDALIGGVRVGSGTRLTARSPIDSSIVLGTFAGADRSGGGSGLCRALSSFCRLKCATSA